MSVRHPVDEPGERPLTADVVIGGGGAPNGENSRGKVQNVPGDSSVRSETGIRRSAGLDCHSRARSADFCVEGGQDLGTVRTVRKIVVAAAARLDPQCVVCGIKLEPLEVRVRDRERVLVRRVVTHTVWAGDQPARAAPEDMVVDNGDGVAR